MFNGEIVFGIGDVKHLEADDINRYYTQRVIELIY